MSVPKKPQKHQDAIGYVTDLATEVGKSWFRMICDLVTKNGASTLDSASIRELVAIYTNAASYIGISSLPTTGAAHVAKGPPVDRLEQITGFKNFKLLADTLDIRFDKRIALIFGANGSGKSSVCEALEVLASPASPNRPLENVRVTGAGAPTFKFKFKTDSAQQKWTPSAGYGLRQTTVRYFDTSIAIANVKNQVDLGRVVTLSPFRLYVFDRVKDLTTTFRHELQHKRQEDSAELGTALAQIRSTFEDFPRHPLATVDDDAGNLLDKEIKLGEGFNDQNILGAKQVAIGELEKASSDEGLKLLQAEHHELEQLIESVSQLGTLSTQLWSLEAKSSAEALKKKQAAQRELSCMLIPEDCTFDTLVVLLRAASRICPLDAAAGQSCPLCKRSLGVSEVELFRQYSDILEGELEREIAALKQNLGKAEKIAEEIHTLDTNAWDKLTTIPSETIARMKSLSGTIISGCSLSQEETTEARTAVEELKESVVNLKSQIDAKQNAITAARAGRDEILKQLASLRAELKPLEYAYAVAAHLDQLKAAARLAERVRFWDQNLPAFTQVLRKTTDQAKVAHEELVVSDFQARLDKEYKALAEKDMVAFGVSLTPKGADAVVTVLPRIGGRDIELVLSEGEQRVHALALFFAEIESCKQSVLVFDDPVSSFDYNYIANYCLRLRDFALMRPECQVVVLTHNWEFFVQLQRTMNKGQLSQDLAVQVLENCAFAADYSEKPAELKNDIGAVLGASGEPSKAEKEALAANMRRLIEAVVNTHVFNNQRHQFKQKTLQVSAFSSFTKVVPLFPHEASKLQDLYSKLSVSEHDDPQNAYVNTDKAMFQSRYDEILSVETAVVARK